MDVVILAWNDQDVLPAAIQSALASDIPDIRVLVVDNGSDPPATVPEDPRVELVREEGNRGVAAGRNIGVSQGRAPFICLLDSDARLETGCLAKLVAVLEGEPTVGLAAPVFVGQPPEASAGRAPSLRVKLSRALDLRDVYEPLGFPTNGVRGVDFAIGACQLFRRIAFDGIGGLDETYFYGPEDVDFCLRLRIAGWGVVQVTGARCHHPPRRRFRRLTSWRGSAHAWAVLRHQWRHRRFRSRVH